MMMKNTRWNERWTEYAIIFCGTTMAAMAFGLFILPAGFLAGGVSGSARLLTGVIDIPLSLVVLIINVTLFLLGYFLMGQSFVIRSLFSTLYFPGMLELMQRIDFPAELLPMPVCATSAGLLLGLGATLVIRGKGSEGGYDILAIILNSRFGVPIALVVNGIDAVLIMIQIPGASAVQIVGGFLTIAICAVVMHLALAFSERSKNHAIIIQ